MDTLHTQRSVRWASYCSSRPGGAGLPVFQPHPFPLPGHLLSHLLLSNPLCPPSTNLRTHHSWLLQPPYFRRGGRKCKISEVGAHTLEYVSLPARLFHLNTFVQQEPWAQGGKHPGAMHNWSCSCRFKYKSSHNCVCCSLRNGHTKYHHMDWTGLRKLKVLTN